jgi:hypothetical protein
MNWRLGGGIGALIREGGVSAKRHDMVEPGMIWTRWPVSTWWTSTKVGSNATT